MYERYPNMKVYLFYSILFYSILFYSILGCVLPLQEVALRQSPPSFSVLCCPCPYRSLLSTVSSLQRCFGLPTDLNDNNNNGIQKRNSRFFTISSLRRELSPTRTLKRPLRNRVQITCNTSSAYHVQHAVCHLVRRDSSAIEFDSVGIALILALSLLAEPLNR